MSKSKQLRAELKNKLGANSRQISVRYNGSLYVKIQDAQFNIEQVEEVAKSFESYQRCEATGEILQGGNTFVFVEYGDKAIAQLNEMYSQEVEEMSQEVERWKKEDTGTSACGYYDLSKYGMYANYYNNQWTLVCNTTRRDLKRSGSYQLAASINEAIIKKQNQKSHNFHVYGSSYKTIAKFKVKQIK